MVCSACGCEQVAGAQFCRQCGARFAPPMLDQQQAYAGYVNALVAEQRMRVRQNLQPLGITWIMFGVYRVVTGLVGAAIVHSLGHSGMFGDSQVFFTGLFGVLAPFIAVISVLMGAGSVIAGCGLLSRQSWGRTIAIVMGVISLIKIPFGTALGIYTLWVLAPRASWAEWESLQQRG